MRYFWGSLCCAGVIWVAGGSTVHATDSPSASTNGPPQGSMRDHSHASSGKKVSARERAIAKFDTDGDRQLSAEERQAARSTISQQRRAAQVAIDAAQYAGSPGSGANGQLTGMSGGGSCMHGGGMGSASMAGMGGGMGRGRR